MKKVYKVAFVLALILDFSTTSFGQRPTISANSKIDFAGQVANLELITELSIDGSLDNVDFEVLRNMKFLSHLDLSSLSGDVLEHGAFQRFERLREIILPSSLKLIDGYAFSGCLNLRRVVFGANLQIIGGHVFQGCTSLESVEFPNNVTSIGSFAFFGCDNLVSVKALSKVPPQLGYMSFSSRIKTVLYVSTEVAREYKFARGWSDYFGSGNRIKHY